MDLYQDLLATLQALDGNLHLNAAIETQSQESYDLQQQRLIAARRLIEEAAAHAYCLNIGAVSHLRMSSKRMGEPRHIQTSKMRKDEILALLADGEFA